MTGRTRVGPNGEHQDSRDLIGGTGWYAFGAPAVLRPEHGRSLAAVRVQAEHALRVMLEEVRRGERTRVSADEVIDVLVAAGATRESATSAVLDLIARGLERRAQEAHRGE